MSVIEPLSIDGIIQDEKVRANLERWRDQLNQLLTFIHIGSGDPESNELGSKGHLYLRTSNGTLYTKSTDSLKTGWVLNS